MAEEKSPLLPSRRTEAKWYHYIGDFLNTLKAFIGTNYQALPFAFCQSGLVFGIVGVLFIATLTDHCCQLLVRCKNHVINRICEHEAAKGEMRMRDLVALRQRLERTVGYGELGRQVFGSWCYQVIQLLVGFTQYTTCICYFIFIGNTIFEMIPLRSAVNETDLVNVTIHHTNLGNGVPMLNIDNIGRYKRSALYEGENDFINPHTDDKSFTSFHSPSSDATSGLVSTIFTTSATLVTSSANASETTLPITTERTTTQVVNHTTAKPPPSPRPIRIPTGIDLKYLVMFPLPFFILTSLIRKLRLLAPFSLIATAALGVGAITILVVLALSFELSSEFSYVKLLTLPLFVGQLISAYEGIGCILPIESSMEGNRQSFPTMLRTSIFTVFVILCTYGTIGYLHYGDKVKQLIVLNIPQHHPISFFVDITLILSVLFTYPLQCYPVLEIVESYFFSPGRCCGPKEPRLEYDEISPNRTIQSEEEAGLLALESSIEASASEVAVVIPPEVSAWKRNVVRILVTLSIMAFAVGLRNSYAYVGAFTGAVGCSLLAYIIPCAMHLKLRNERLPLAVIVKDWFIILLSIVASLLTLVVIIQKIITHQVV